MKLVSFRRGEVDSWGMVVSDGIVDGQRSSPHLPTLRSALASQTIDELAATLAGGAAEESVDEVVLLPPIPDPGKVLCAGVNYVDHRVESGIDSRPAHPTVFVRFADSQVGSGAPIPRPAETDELDFEGEIAAVIGRRAHRVAEEDALDHVAGYACFNDLSVRNWQMHSSQWIPGKNFLGVGSFGPWLVTADELPESSDLELVTRVDGQEFQHARLSEAIFSVAQLIAYISTFTALAPGDVIVTGTPGGVGGALDPPVFLAPGNVVEVEATGLGILRNEIVEASAA